MPKTIDTLVDDIYGVFDKDVNISEEQSKEFGEQVAKMMTIRINEERKHVPFRLSQAGEDCNRKLWYKANTPELGEPLPPAARMKFLFGDLTELLLLFLAKISGHKIEGEQDEVSIAGVKGHRDAVIDGRIVDVKSASSFGFRKFSGHALQSDDPFGYRKQIGAYAWGSKTDPLVTDSGVVSFLAMDKQMGHVALDTYPTDNVDYEKLVERKKGIIALRTPPDRSYDPVPEGKSGNMKLDVKCSYCEFKKTCFPQLRTFIYSTGPVYLTSVERQPKVPEVFD